MPNQENARPHSRVPPWAAATTGTGGCRRSRARSIEVVTIATAPSLSRQKSYRQSGSAIIRALKYCSRVSGSRYLAFGRVTAFCLVEMAISANASRVVPYTCMWRRVSSDIRWPGPARPDGCTNELTGVTALDATTVPSLVRCCSAITVTTTEASPATIAARARPIAPAEPPPPPVSAAENFSSRMPSVSTSSPASICSPYPALASE